MNRPFQTRINDKPRFQGAVSSPGIYPAIKSYRQGTAVLIFTPIFLPIVTALGIDPTYFGIIMVLNLRIGLCIPPVGGVLFVGVGVENTTIAKVIKPLLPLFVAMIVALFIVLMYRS